VNIGRNKMGIREEIERLGGCHIRAARRLRAICHKCKWADDWGCPLVDARGRSLLWYHSMAIHMFTRFLALFDEHLGECVVERTARQGEFLKERGQRLGDILVGVINDVGDEIIRPGDHIAIYKKAAKESDD